MAVPDKRRQHDKSVGGHQFEVRHGIAAAIAIDFLNRPRNREEFPQREANLAILHRKMHRKRNRIVTAENRNLFPRKNRCVEFDDVNEWQTSTANHRWETVHIAPELCIQSTCVRKWADPGAWEGTPSATTQGPVHVSVSLPFPMNFFQGKCPGEAWRTGSH